MNPAPTYVIWVLPPFGREMHYEVYGQPLVMPEDESARTRFRNLSPQQNPTQAYQPGFMVMKSGESVDKSDAQLGFKFE